MREEQMKITRLAPAFCVSDQLQPEDLPRVREAGYRAVINNRPDGEEDGQPTSAQLSAEADKLGLSYFHIPIVPGQMSDEDAVALKNAAAAGPVLAFCRTGARSTSLWKRSVELADSSE
jgi:sulfide:quinone oxidoreductase